MECIAQLLPSWPVAPTQIRGTAATQLIEIYLENIAAPSIVLWESGQFINFDFEHQVAVWLFIFADKRALVDRWMLAICTRQQRGDV